MYTKWSSLCSNSHKVFAVLIRTALNLETGNALHHKRLVGLDVQPSRFSQAPKEVVRGNKPDPVQQPGSLGL